MAVDRVEGRFEQVARFAVDAADGVFQGFHALRWSAAWASRYSFLSRAVSSSCSAARLTAPSSAMAFCEAGDLACKQALAGTAVGQFGSSGRSAAVVDPASVNWAANCSVFRAAACPSVSGRRSGCAGVRGCSICRRCSSRPRRALVAVSRASPGCRQAFPSPGGLPGVLQLVFHGVGRLGLDLLGALAARSASMRLSSRSARPVGKDVLQLAFARAGKLRLRSARSKSAFAVRARRAPRARLLPAGCGLRHQHLDAGKPSRPRRSCRRRPSPAPVSPSSSGQLGQLSPADVPLLAVAFRPPG